MDASTPVWVVLLVAAIGVTGTLLAALLTQALTTRREARRAREEADRMQDLAREDAAREDAAREREVARAAGERLLTEKRAAYSELLLALSRATRHVGYKRDYRVARNGAVVPIEMGPLADEVDRAYATVQVLADREVLEPAAKAHHNLLVTVAHLEASHFSVTRVDEGRELVTEHLRDYLAAVRRDLGIEADLPVEA